MTSEIVVMNKEAVALSADSAGTYGPEGKEKIFITSKIFALSNYCPVGIMIYGTMSFLGVPWETIIKTYRKYLGSKKFGILYDYADDFFKYLKKNRELFPDDMRRKFFLNSVGAYYNLIIREAFKHVIKEWIKRIYDLTGEKLRQVVIETIEKHYASWKDRDLLPTVRKNDFDKLKKEYYGEIKKIVKSKFKKVRLKRDEVEKLVEIGLSLYVKPRGDFKNTLSGVIIVGFGEKDIFPKLISFKTEGLVSFKTEQVVYDILKYEQTKKIAISEENDVTIVPFALGEMAYLFMAGIDRMYRLVIAEGVDSLLNLYSEKIANEIADDDRDVLLGRIREIGEEVVINFLRLLYQYERDVYVDPVLDVVRASPKEKLAEMAEMLVGLTAFKRSVTLGPETVKEPIDVAIISKGDGLIWIKRKHYFSPELNPHFFTRNSLGGVNDEKSQKRKRKGKNL